MSFDLLLQRETESNWARGPDASALPLDFTPAERRALSQLEPSTRAHVVEVVGWARQRGIPARLSTTSVIYTPERSAENYARGLSSIEPGKVGWHHVGRAYHLVVVNPRTRQLDEAAYARVAAYARSRGGEWLGDKVVVTSRGPVKDLAHFEYHPGLKLGRAGLPGSYRGSALAAQEYRQAQDRAKKYG